MDGEIEQSWKSALTREFEKDYFKKLTAHVTADYLLADSPVYPPASQVFSALNQTPLTKVKVVILGQDPYHGPGQAMGLSFSVPDKVRIPPSLLNIYKELQNDLGIPIPTSGNLTHWAQQGVLLLNATLTVQESKPGSHQKLGWEQFTDRVIQTISDEQKHVVFLLWGAFAGTKSSLVDEQKHLILKAAHPSPLSAHRGFLGCRHFSQTNDYLRKHGVTEIDWQL